MEENPPNSHRNFKTCTFCPTDKPEQELYKCPKCEALYCSVRCYRNKKHQQCSEKFYRKQCEEFAGEQENSDAPNIKRPTTTFEQYMEGERQRSGTSELDEKLVNPEIPVPVGDDEQILFDSDDEPEYLGDIVESTMKQFERMDDEELDRNLLAAGLPIGVAGGSEGVNQEQLEQLYQQLDEEERKTFTAMAEGLFQDEFQSFTNCFQSKKKKP